MREKVTFKYQYKHLVVWSKKCILSNLVYTSGCMIEKGILFKSTLLNVSM